MKILYEPVAVKHFSVIFLLGAANQGQAIGFISEKAKDNVLSRNIFQTKTSVYAASAGFEEINYIGECKLCERQS